MLNVFSKNKLSVLGQCLSVKNFKFILKKREPLKKYWYLVLLWIIVTIPLVFLCTVFAAFRLHHSSSFHSWSLYRESYYWLCVIYYSDSFSKTDILYLLAYWIWLHETKLDLIGLNRSKETEMDSKVDKIRWFMALNQKKTTECFIMVWLLSSIGDI